MSPDLFTTEVDRARRQYDVYEARGCYVAAWAPFDEAEAAYRSQQALAMARLMREAGFKDLAGLRILDVGCGRGRHVRAFVDVGAEPAAVQGIDIHEPSIAVAKSASPQLVFSVFDGRDIPFPNASFDLVTQHVVFSSIALLDLRRHLAARWCASFDLAATCSGGTHCGCRDSQTRVSLDSTSVSCSASCRCGAPHRLEPSLGECVRLPPVGRRFVRNVLDRVPVLNYPSTHVAALIGPKP